jgi:pimeloyl-ACP methyl ester carboxylesterase
MRSTVDITGRGEPLVLIHGLATTRSIWRHAAPRLAATAAIEPRGQLGPACGLRRAD